MTYQSCGCWLGAWNSILPAPMCDFHKGNTTAPFQTTNAAMEARLTRIEMMLDALLKRIGVPT